MHQKICEQLFQIEQEHEVYILYAVESGSRAWGFASRDSDYDVRFIYVHKLDWYLSLREQRDVIECPISNDLDISGWDLRKALSLFSKSNPPLLEWLGSPVTYKDSRGLAGKLRDMLSGSFSSQRCMYHYLHMASGNYREYLKGEVVRLKKYLYVLRPILACLWIERHGTMPPTEFSKLVTDACLPVSLNTAIDQLLARKMSGDELDSAPRIPELNEFIDHMLGHYSQLSGKRPVSAVDYDALDHLFREMLQTAWGDTL